uniref:SET domain-containing protein n=2 Tax=Caenorhabditis tropicalis TaxID=1561998 RepID=A0A1I7TLU4_9PELO
MGNTNTVLSLYQNFGKFDVDERKPSLHCKRPTDNEKCFICLQSEAEVPEKFLSEAKKNLKSLDEQSRAEAIERLGDLVQCEEDDCPHKFHLHCLTYLRTMPWFQIQYLSLEQNFNKIRCPDHYCEICFTEGNIQSSARGKLIRSKEEVRAFHVNCRPSGSTPTTNGMISLQKRMEYKGPHFNICSQCAGKHPRYGKNKLVKCFSCVNTYHNACQQLDKFDVNDPDRCEDCIYDTQIRCSDLVLMKRGRSVFVAAEMMDWKNDKMGNPKCFIKYKNNGIPSNWVATNAIFRPRTKLGASFFEKMKEKDSLKALKQNLNNYAIEWSTMSSHMKAIYYSKPNIPARSPPQFREEYKVHISAAKYFPTGFTLPTPAPTNQNLKLDYTSERGFGIAAMEMIEKHDVIGDYIGEILSYAELRRRGGLGRASNDRERKLYCFETKIIINGKKKTCGIDASVLHNEISMINSSCSPNCEVSKIPVDVGDGVKFIVLRVIAKRKIEKNEEVTICYNWSRFNCWCGLTNRCKKAMKSVDWSPPSITAPNSENDENCILEGSTRKHKAAKRKRTGTPFAAINKKPKQKYLQMANKTIALHHAFREAYIDFPPDYVKKASAHSTRPTTSECPNCLICEDTVVPSNVEQDFHNLLDQNTQKLTKRSKRKNVHKELKEHSGDLLVCAEKGCPYKFHLPCLVNHRPIQNYEALYLCLEQNGGLIKCLDHYCEICFAEGLIQSAGRGKLNKAKNQVRAFHLNCNPARCSDGEEGSNDIILPESTIFTGNHFMICHQCGGEEEGEVSNVKPVLGLSTRSAMDQNTPRLTTEKENVWLASTETRYERVMEFTDEGTLTQVEFRTSKLSKWIPLNAVFCPNPKIAYTLFKNMRKIECLTIDCGEQCNCGKNAEWSTLAKELKLRMEFKPKIVKRQFPTFRDSYEYHSSFLTLLPKNFDSIPETRDHPGIKVVSTKEKGFSTKAIKTLRRNEFIDFYNGQLISLEEKTRRMNIGSRSGDYECKFYIYETRLTKKGRRMTCFIDAAVHQNAMSMLNSSCKPNCITVNDYRSHRFAPGYVLELLAIRTVSEIQEGVHMTLDYQWKNFPCWCQATASCKTSNEQDWSIPTCSLRKSIEEENEAEVKREANKAARELNDRKKGLKRTAPEYVSHYALRSKNKRIKRTECEVDNEEEVDGSRQNQVIDRGCSLDTGMSDNLNHDNRIKPTVNVHTLQAHQVECLSSTQMNVHSDYDKQVGPTDKLCSHSNTNQEPNDDPENKDATA